MDISEEWKEIGLQKWLEKAQGRRNRRWPNNRLKEQIAKYWQLKEKKVLRVEGVNRTESREKGKAVKVKGGERTGNR